MDAQGTVGVTCVSDGTVCLAFQRLRQRLADPALAPDLGPGPRLGSHAGVLPQSVLSLLPAQPTPAAVLVAFIDHEADPGILLTVRAPHLRQHAGQISFPGGRIEAGDADAAAAALREAHEEIGLEPGQVQILGQLPEQLVLTGFCITPVVARINQSFTPRLDPGEVQELFELPLSQLLDAANQQFHQRDIGGVGVEMRDIHYGTRRIWGATAGILLTLREYAIAG